MSISTRNPELLEQPQPSQEDEYSWLDESVNRINAYTNQINEIDKKLGRSDRAACINETIIPISSMAVKAPHYGMETQEELEAEQELQMISDQEKFDQENPTWFEESLEILDLTVTGQFGGVR